MTKLARWMVFCLLLWAVGARASQVHPARGIVLNLDPAHRSLVVSCDSIPGYMDAMEMPFVVRDGKEVEALRPGSTIRFDIVRRGNNLYAEHIRKDTTVNFESEPLEAAGLTTLHAALDPAAAAKVLTVGQRVPDFSLTDQTQRKIDLTHFRGKVVALTFGYSRCPNPNYCFRLSNNLAGLQKRFHARAGRDLVLLTIMIDPQHDQGATLVQYAGVWKADPAVWHFLTGPPPEVKQVAQMFGMNFWSDEGVFMHSLHTVVIDRQGRMTANIEGNQFTARQLGDLVETVMNRPQ